MVSAWSFITHSIPPALALCRRVMMSDTAESEARSASELGRMSNVPGGNSTDNKKRKVRKKR